LQIVNLSDQKVKVAAALVLHRWSKDQGIQQQTLTPPSPDDLGNGKKFPKRQYSSSKSWLSVSRYLYQLLDPLVSVTEGRHAAPL
jgi:hypothetical protein